MSRSIFISHSSADEALVQKLVDAILGNGCEIRKSDIFCTTLPGMKIPAGTPNYIEAIRKQAECPNLFILIVSPNYLESKFCLCELGAAWALDLPLFPFVVPPLKRSEIKTTLAVTQSGLINDSDFLDELRDKIKEFHSSSVSTGAWNAAKKAFLAGLPAIIHSLPTPAIVPKSLLDEAQQDFAQATEEIVKRDTTIEKLTAQIAALEKVKDNAGVAKVRAEFSNDTAELEQLIKDARGKIKVLKRGTPYVLFCQLKNESAHFASTRSSEMIDASVNANEIYYDDPGFRPNFEKAKVKDADAAIEALEAFIDNDDHQAAVSSYAEENDLELDLRDFDTWINLFSVADPAYDKYAIDVIRDGKKCNKVECPEGLEFVNVDAEKLRIFFLSVIWRAHHASIPPYENICLDYEDERLIRNIILTGKASSPNDYPVFGSVLVNAREKNAIVKEIVGAMTRCPWQERSGKNVFVAMFGGVAWHCIMASDASGDPNNGLFFAENKIWLPNQDIFQFEPFQNAQASIDLIAAGEHVKARRKPLD